MTEHSLSTESAWDSLPLPLLLPLVLSLFQINKNKQPHLYLKIKIISLKFFKVFVSLS